MCATSHSQELNFDCLPAKIAISPAISRYCNIYIYTLEVQRLIFKPTEVYRNILTSGHLTRPTIRLGQSTPRGVGSMQCRIVRHSRRRSGAPQVQPPSGHEEPVAVGVSRRRFGKEDRPHDTPRVLMAKWKGSCCSAFVLLAKFASEIRNTPLRSA